MTRQEQLLRYRNRYENGRHMGGYPGEPQKEHPCRILPGICCVL